MSLYAVSVDPPAASQRLKRKLRASFTFLSDADGTLLDALNIRHRQAAPSGEDIAFPTAVLVDGSGVVRWTFQSDTYRQRARPDEIFAALDGL